MIAFWHHFQYKLRHHFKHRGDAVTDDKVRENRIRRMADRQGYRLMKSRSRDPRAVDYGLYGLVDIQTGGSVFPALAGRWVCSQELDDVEAFLTEPSEEENG